MVLVLSFNQKQAKVKDKTLWLVEAILIATGVLLVLQSFRFIQAEELTSLFDSQAFRGSLKVIDKFNWLGKLMNWIISGFSVVGLFLICLQRLLSLLYLSGRNLFDTVYDLKNGLSGGPGRDAFGVRSMFTNAAHGGQGYGTGLDALVGFGLSLLPNVKKYSDFNPERMAYNVQEDDSCTTYMLKTAIPTIMMIFFLSMGYNGTLWQGYGVIVDAMGTAGSNLVSQDLSSVVNNAMNTGKSYKFSWDADGSEYGDFMQDMVKSVYKQALKNGKDYSSDTQQTVGKYVDNIFLTGKGYKDSKKINLGSTGKTTAIAKGKSSIFTDADTLAKAIGTVTGFKGEDDAGNLEFSVISNSTSSGYQSANTAEVVISAYDLGLNSSSGSNYIHVIINRKKNSDETMYWHSVDDGESAKKSTSTSSTSSKDATSSGNQ